MKLWKYGLTGLFTAAILMTGTITASAAESIYLGDVQTDDSVDVADVIKLQRYLLGTMPLQSVEIIAADMNQDQTIDIYDLALLKRAVLSGNWERIPLGEEETEPTADPTEAPTEDTQEPTEVPTEEPPSGGDDFISAPIKNILGSLPSQGEANLVVFYVDFPDCPYTYEPSLEELNAICFGNPEDAQNDNYPFNSFSSFYARSSKGVMQLGGQVFRYTTSENRAAYDQDKDKLMRECYDAFNDQVDFSQFDGDGDGIIDATLFTVPTAAGDDDWWPCAGPTGDYMYQVDGKTIGHIITGNAEITSATDYKNFVSSYAHEMGHCMGLPDYYLYYSEDYDSMHGNAGTELMDADAYSDFGCFSKLMLGWYRENQIQVFDPNKGTEQSFTLANAQTDAGNCVILPYGEPDGNYFSEYMIIEYVTPEGSNYGINRDLWYWQSVAPGIRVYHIKADFADNGWWTYFKYENGSEFTNYDDDGIRLIRLANDAEGGNVFTTGDVIDGNISGFHWYAADESESVETGYTVSVGELADGNYTITVSLNAS